MGTLNDVFVYADIDDVSHDRHDDYVELVIDERATRQNATFTGNDLDEVVAQALEWLDSRALDHDTVADAAWQRGREAGLREARLNAEIEAYLDEAIPALPAPIETAPATTMAASPFEINEGTTLSLVIPIQIARA